MEPRRRFDNRGLVALTDSLGGETELDEFLVTVLRCWAHDDLRTDQTVTRMGEIAVRFVRRLVATGVDAPRLVSGADCDAFINAPSRTGDAPSIGTRHFRRTTLRAMWRTGRTLDLVAGDPTIDTELPPRSTRAARPLTDDEIHLCRTTTFGPRFRDLRRPTAWALAEATAATSEIPTIRHRDLLLTRDGLAVGLPGTRRLRPRTIALTEWGQTIVTQRLDELSDDLDDLLCYSGSAPARSVARHAAACTLIAAVLSKAGLDREPDVRPASVRHWRARSAFDGGASIETVANLLGHRSLDEAATAVAHDWMAS
jgi:site-specific recombinase XerD